MSKKGSKGQTLKGLESLALIDKNKLKQNNPVEQTSRAPLKQGSNTESVRKQEHKMQSNESKLVSIKTADPKQNRTWYDSQLNEKKDYGHNPNPFDFVFFSSKKPNTYTQTEFDALSVLQSGYLKFNLKTLTPVHIVGKQTPAKEGETIKKSFFYRQGGTPCIPGSSIRGMLRSFIETVTNGWVSQAQEKDKRGENVYKPELKKRHIEFASWEPKEHDHGCIEMKRKVESAIPTNFRPNLNSDKIDIATYLFGYVMDTKGTNTSIARAGKVIVEDAIIEDSLKDHKMVDTASEAFMGGPSPNVGNWWYMRPKEVWKRTVRLNGTPNDFAQIIGEGFWGRKFYYHQKPESCIQWYWDKKDDFKKNKIELYKYDIETLDARQSVSFSIYIDRLPKPLVSLLCLSLCLPGAIRHKLGYGKAFGYGSVEFTLASAMLRDEKTKTPDWPDDFKPIDDATLKSTYLADGWKNKNIEPFIDKLALNELARILVYDEKDNILFTYPPYDNKNFKKAIRASEFSNVKTIPLSNKINPITEKQAMNVAKELWNVKRTIHFPLYQARAKGYSKIRSRVP